MMRKLVLVSLVFVAVSVTVLAFALPAIAQEMKKDEKVAKGEQVTITGRFSCTFCTLGHKDKFCNKECCVKCVESGDPPSLTDAQGRKFLLLSGEKEQPLMTADRKELLGGWVTVKGLSVEGKGIQAIYVDDIKKAEEPAKEEEGKKVTMTGKLSCTFCVLAHPEMTCGKDCCLKCVKSGDPVMLTDDKGENYILTSGEKEHKLMTDERMEMLGGKVTVEGMLVKSSGLQAIYVDSMKVADEKK